MKPRRLHTRHASDAESTGLLHWQVTNRWQAAQRAALKPFGLTHVQFVLLASGDGHRGRGGPGQSGARRRGGLRRRLLRRHPDRPGFTRALQALQERATTTA